jgi:hypothetical protein
MIELVWGIINIVLILICLINYIKITKLIIEKLGLFASLIFIVFTISFLNESSKEKFHEKTTEINNEVIYTNSKSKIIEDKLVTKIETRISFGKRKDTLYITSKTNRYGFVIGTDWISHYSSLEEVKNSKNTYKYNVLGTLEWNILGIKVYKEIKEFNGILKL